MAKKFHHIKFDEKSHTYTNTKTKQKYLSCTSFISKFEKPFVATEKLTAKTQKELGLTHEEVIAFWAKTNEVAKIRGSKIHKFLEEDFKKDRVVKKPIKDKVTPYYSEMELYSYRKFFERIRQNEKDNYEVMIEQILYSDEFEIAGQSDKVLIDTDITIQDFKSNDKDLTKSYSNFKGPIDHIRASPLEEYSLQLSIYGYFAEKIFNKTVKELKIYHLRNSRVEEIVLPYRKYDVLNMLHYYKENNKQI